MENKYSVGGERSWVHAAGVKCSLCWGIRPPPAAAGGGVNMSLSMLCAAQQSMRQENRTVTLTVIHFDRTQTLLPLHVSGWFLMLLPSCTTSLPGKISEVRNTA